VKTSITDKHKTKGDRNENYVCIFAESSKRKLAKQQENKKANLQPKKAENLPLCRIKKGRNDKTSKQFVILIREQNGGMCVCGQTKWEMAQAKGRRKQWGKMCKGGINVSSL
jgi:hypothetical protein